MALFLQKRQWLLIFDKTSNALAYWMIKIFAHKYAKVNIVQICKFGCILSIILSMVTI